MSNYTDFDYDYTADYAANNQVLLEEIEYLNSIRALYMVTYISMCVVGVVLNSYVIITGFRKFRSHSNVTVWQRHTFAWILALAVTHLVFSAFLVLQFLYALWHFNWHAGAALCKLSSYIFYFSMFSTAALLSLTSVSSCIGSSECLKSVCANRGMSMVIFMVLSSLTFGAILSSPSLLSRELRQTSLGMQCIDDYDLDKENTTDYGLAKLTAVVLCRFLLGVLVPVFVMIFSACIAKRLGAEEEGTLKRVTCVVKVAYFICWTPLLSMALIQIKVGESFKYGLPAATVLAAAHSFVNPVIYLLVGRKSNMEWMMEAPDKKTRNATELDALKV